MQILVATDHRFWRQTLGSHQRIYHPLKFLRSQGHDVEGMFVGTPTIDDVHTIRGLDFVEIESTQPVMANTPSASAATNRTSRIRSMLRECVHRLRRMPAAVAYALRTGQRSVPSSFALSRREPKLGDFIRSIAIVKLNRRLTKHLPEVLIVEYLRLSYLVDAIPATLRARLTVLLDTHDVISERRQRFHDAGLPHDIDVTPAEESAALLNYDAVIAIQSRHAAVFRALAPNRTVLVAGHSERMAGAKHPELAEPRFLFLGSDMLPNLDAARRLALKIWPEVERRLAGNASLTIVGKVGTALTNCDLPSSVQVKGHVASLDETYFTPDIFLNPVSFGGGLKIKNVEALARGMALVTTPIGAEGLETGAGSALLVADSDQEFVDAACRIANDRALRVSLSTAAQSFAIRYLDPESTYGELVQYLDHRRSSLTGERNFRPCMGAM